MKPSDFAYHLTTYLSKYLPGQLGVSTNTIKSYRDTFSLFLKYCHEAKGIRPETLNLQRFTRELVEDFLLWIEVERNCSASTRNQRLAAIHAFFKYLQFEAPEQMLLCQQILAVQFKRKPKPTVNYLSLEGIKAILAQPDATTLNGRRDLVMLCLLYDTGARVQEIADLTVRDVRLAEPLTIKLTGKGQKSRLVPLMSQTASLLKHYIIERRLNTPVTQAYPLFCNRVNQKLTRAGISYILEKYVEQARISAPDKIPDTVTPHCFRHSKAMHLLQAGVNLVYIRDLLGHVDIKTTEVYARADADMKRKALENAYNSPAPGQISSWQENESIMTWLHSLCRQN